MTSAPLPRTEPTGDVIQRTLALPADVTKAVFTVAAADREGKKQAVFRHPPAA